MWTVDTLNSLPKVEPHVHLEGSATPRLLQQLAAQNRIALDQEYHLPESSTTLPALKRFSATPTEPYSPSEFVSLFLAVTRSIRSSDELALVARHYFESAQLQNIKHSWIYCTAHTFQRLSLPLQELWTGLIAAEGHAHRCNTGVSWIFDIVRNVPGDGLDTVKMAVQARQQGVNVRAIGLGGLETPGDVSRFSEAFSLAKAEGFTTIAHAGEGAGPENIWTTLSELNPDRIGHGISAVADPALLDELSRRQITLEVSPWSNILLGITDMDNHPLVKLVNSGVAVVLAADDPGILGKSLVDNYLFAASFLDEKMIHTLAARSLTLV